MTGQVKASAGAPNVLLVQLDGVGFGQASASGGPAATAHLEALVGSGSVYDRFHGSALGWSTRAEVLTGRNHHRIGARAAAEGACGFAEYDLVLPCSAVSVGTIMAGNGYESAWFGEAHGLAEDLADRAREWIAAHRSQNPDKPFFVYLTADAQSASRQLLQPFVDQYKGAFDAGWEVVRRESLDRQKAMGLVPDDTEFAATDDGSGIANNWSLLSDGERRRVAEAQEVYAGAVTYADAQIGRLMSVLEELRIRRNTLVILIAGDGTASGDSGGSARSAWTTGPVDGHAGGTRRLAVMSWPRRIPAGGRRAQFHHAVDILPTILEAAKITAADSVDGIEQSAFDGVSMGYTWQAAHSPGRRTTQYFEHEGDRAIYHNGWFAVARDNMPWRLYDTSADVCHTNDLAEVYPDKARQLAEIFDDEARANGVYV